MPGISVVIPAHNGRRSLPAVISAIVPECQGHPFEIIVVDDGSADGTRRYLRELEHAGVIRVVEGPCLGVAAAVNAGIRAAVFPFICQIDQDVVIQPGWMQSLLAAIEEPDVAAAQGRYITAGKVGLWARVMGRDLEQRYARIRQRHVDHVCTGNTLYRASALHSVGLLDERFGYAADNDLSYRLLNAGFKLAFCREAVSLHLWRDTCRGYLRQQFGVGYGRLDLVSRHPLRVRGDDVSGPNMILHAAGMTVAVVLLAAALLASSAGMSATPLLIPVMLLLLALATERTVAGVSAWRATRDRACLAFPVAHLLRDGAWAAAIIVWLTRRIARVRGSADHSMARSKDRARGCSAVCGARAISPSILIVVPAFNEVESLSRVVDDIRRAVPDADVLVVNDGSTDATADLLPRLGVHWLTLPESLGVGNAVRAGLRYAQRRGYECVVRIDGDGQHRACDVGRLASSVLTGRADAACGSRYARRTRMGGRHPTKAALALCLSVLVRQRVTDPTTGLWAFGPRAIRLLSSHHPTGYPEPELLLLLHRNNLRFEEVAIRMRPRTTGNTTLTWPRKANALGRTALAVMIVPMRRIEADAGSNR